MFNEQVWGCLCGLGAAFPCHVVAYGRYGRFCGYDCGKECFATELLGMAAKQVFAIGALAFDIVAFGIMSLFNVEMQGIEVDTPADGHVSNPFGTFGSNSSVTKSIALSM